MEISPAPDSRGETSPESHDSPMDVPQSPIVLSLPPDDEPTDLPDTVVLPEDTSTPNPQHSKLGKFGALGFGKRPNKWGLSSVFGHGSDKHVANSLAPVDELSIAVSRSTPSLKRTQSGNTSDNLSLPDVPSTVPPIPLVPSNVDLKKLKKERERLARDAEKAKREQEQKSQRERSRAVMQKRNQILKQNAPSLEIDWQSSRTVLVARSPPVNGTSNKGKQRAAELLPPDIDREDDQEDWLSHRSKARRRDLDDDHSMSSSEVHSISRMSMISFASGESDPGPTRTYRPRPVHNVYNIPRATSISSLRTSSGRGFSPSARSSNSDRQFNREFHERATFGPESSLSDTGSPPPIHELSLSPNHPHSQYHLPEDNTYLKPNNRSLSPRPSDPRYGSLLPITTLHPARSNAYEVDNSSIDSRSASHPTIHPMFQVVSIYNSALT